MKRIILAITLLSSTTWAHGPVAEQASKAIQKVTAQFLAEEKPALQDKFQSVSSTRIGDERFSVKVHLKDQAQAIEYICGLDETVKPVKWGCKKQ